MPDSPNKAPDPQWLEWLAEGDLDQLQSVSWSADKLNRADADGNTILHLAAKRQRPRIMRFLLRRAVLTSVATDLRNKADQTPESLAIQERNALARQYDANPYTRELEGLPRDMHRTLQRAVHTQWDRSRKTLRMLRNHRARKVVSAADPALGLCDRDGHNGLHWAIESNDYAAAKRWVEKNGPLTNGNGEKLVIRAAWRGCTGITRMLMACSSEWRFAKSEHWGTVMHAAVLSRNPITVKAVAEAFSCVPAWSAENGLRKPFDQMRSFDCAGNSPLQLAEILAEYEVAQVLVEHGADPDQACKKPPTLSALRSAVFSDTPGMFEMLLTASKQLDDPAHATNFLFVTMDGLRPNCAEVIEQVLAKCPEITENEEQVRRIRSAIELEASQAEGLSSSEYLRNARRMREVLDRAVAVPGAPAPATAEPEMGM